MEKVVKKKNIFRKVYIALGKKEMLLWRRILGEYKIKKFGCTNEAIGNAGMAWAIDHKRISSSILENVKHGKDISKYIPASKGSEHLVIQQWRKKHSVDDEFCISEVSLCSPKYPFFSCRIDLIMKIKGNITGIEFKGEKKEEDYKYFKKFFLNCPVMMQVVSYAIVYGGIDMYLVWGFRTKKGDIKIKTKLFPWTQLKNSLKSFRVAMNDKILDSFVRNILVWKILKRIRKKNAPKYPKKEKKNESQHYKNEKYLFFSTKEASFIQHNREEIYKHPKLGPIWENYIKDLTIFTLKIKLKNTNDFKNTKIIFKDMKDYPETFQTEFEADF